MANPSFALLTVPVLDPATGTLRVEATFWTSKGNSVAVHRVFQPSSGTTPLTPAQLAAALKVISAQIEAAEATALIPPSPSPFVPYVGVRYDATKPAGTVLAPADTPPDTSVPPAGGG